MNPVRLSIVLNYSVFFYEIIKDKKKAWEICDSGLQAATSKLEDIKEDDFRDSKSLIELLKENKLLWLEQKRLDDLAEQERKLPS